jgi:hypothetical protein
MVFALLRGDWRSGNSPDIHKFLMCSESPKHIGCGHMVFCCPESLSKGTGPDPYFGMDGVHVADFSP